MLVGQWRQTSVDFARPPVRLQLYQVLILIRAVPRDHSVARSSQKAQIIKTNVFGEFDRSSLQTRHSGPLSSPGRIYTRRRHARVTPELCYQKLTEIAGPEVEGLYSASQRSLRAHKAQWVLVYFGHSLSLAVSATFPAHPWRPWHFSRPPHNWYSTLRKALLKGDAVAEAAMRDVLEEESEKHGLDSPEAWANFVARLPESATIHRLGDVESILEIIITGYKRNEPAKATEESEKVESFPAAHWADPHNRRLFMDQMTARLGGKIEDLYDISTRAILKHGGAGVSREFCSHLTNCPAWGLLMKHSDAATSAVMVEYPEHSWMPWKFSRYPRGMFRGLATALREGNPHAIAMLRSYLDDTAHTTTLTPDTAKDLPLPVIRFLNRIGGADFVSALLSDTSASKISTPSVYSFDRQSASYWKEVSNQRQFFDFLKAQVGGTFEDLYSLTWATVVRSGGKALLMKYRESVPEAVTAIYPNHLWKPWRFKKAPHGFWRQLRARLGDTNDKEAIRLVRDYVKDLEAKLGLSSADQWRRLLQRSDSLPPAVKSQILWLGGLSFVLAQAYPEHEWADQSQPPALAKYSNEELSPSYWNDEAKIRDYVDFMRRQLGGTLEGLYTLSSHDFFDTGAHSLLWKLGNRQKVLKVAYPDHPWELWRFASSKLQDWSQLGKSLKDNDTEAIAQIRRYIEYTQEQLGLESLDGWESVSTKTLGTTSIRRINALGGLKFVLQKTHPHHHWTGLGAGSLAAKQRKLKHRVDALVPKTRTKSNKA